MDYRVRSWDKVLGLGFFELPQVLNCKSRIFVGLGPSENDEGWLCWYVHMLRCTPSKTRDNSDSLLFVTLVSFLHFLAGLSIFSGRPGITSKIISVSCVSQACTVPQTISPGSNTSTSPGLSTGSTGSPASEAPAGKRFSFPASAAARPLASTYQP